MATQNQVLPLAECTFNHAGLQSVISHLRDHMPFTASPDINLRGAAFGFLSAGATDDGAHDLPFRKNHALYYELHKHGDPNWRDGMRDHCLQAVMDEVSSSAPLDVAGHLPKGDQLTMLDRAGAGATMLIHCPATRPPGSSAIPEEVKMEVFLPRALMTERPDVEVAISRIIQYFAEHVAVPSMERWDLANKASTWNVNRAPRTPRAPVYRAAKQGIIPPSDSPRYIFYGRHRGDLEELIASDPRTAQFALSPPIGVLPTVADAAPHTSFPVAAPRTQPPLTAPVATRPGPAVHGPAPVTPGNAVEEGDWDVMDGYISPVGKEHIKLAYSPSDPYTQQDLIALADAHYDSQGNVKASTSRSAHGKQRAAAGDDDADLSDVLAALQSRIAELEDVNVSQEEEIVNLRAALSMAGES